MHRQFERLRPAALAIILSTLLGGALADDWNQFRGPGGSGRYEGSEPLPIEWGPESDFLWTARLPGRGASSPSVFEDAVVVTAYEGYGLDAEAPGQPDELRLHVLCFDRSNGSLRWTLTRPGTENTPKATPRRVDHGYATPTAYCDRTGVYVYFGVNGLVAIDWDGTERWSRLRGTQTKGFGTATSPVRFGTVVIQNHSIEGGPLAAYDIATGDEVWTADEIVSAWSTPGLFENDRGETELVISHKNLVRGFAPETGRELWRCEGVDDYTVPVIVGHGGVIWCFGGRQNRCIRIRLGGRGDITGSHRDWVVTTGANVTSPVLHEGKLFNVHDKALWLVMDAETGETLAKSRLPYRERVYPSVVYGDGRLYAQTRDAGLLVLAPTVEYTELARNLLEPDTLWNAGPALAGGVIYLRSDSRLYAIGSQD